MPRLFVAIDLPPGQRQYIKTICSGLPGARWIKPEQIHLTLRFIGEVDDRLFREIAGNLAEVRTEPLCLKIKGVGQFPLRRSPRVLWVGVEENAKLVELRNRIESRLVQTGLEPENRKFSPHITIARFKKETPRKALGDFLKTHDRLELPAFPVAQFHLYSSRLDSNGAIHRLEMSFPVPVS